MIKNLAYTCVLLTLIVNTPLNCAKPQTALTRTEKALGPAVGLAATYAFIFLAGSCREPFPGQGFADFYKFSAQAAGVITALSLPLWLYMFNKVDHGESHD